MKRLIRWLIELSGFNLEYELKKAIKGQALVDFVVKIAGFSQEDPTVPVGKLWVLFLDGSSCRVGRGLRMHLTSTNGWEHHYMTMLTIKVTNNEVEYEALVIGFSMVQQMGAIEIEAKADSQVVVNHILGLYATKGKKLKKYLAWVWELQDLFSYLNINQIPRVENEVAEKLARAASGTDEASLSWLILEIIIEILAIKSKLGILTSAILEWASGVAKYLYGGRLPKTREEARQIKRKAARILLINGILYKRGFSTPLLQCISVQEAQYVLAKIHEGICGNYSSGRTLARKAVRAVYYLPNVMRDAREFTNKCIECQKYTPSEELTFVMTPWHVAQCGVDLVRLFPPGKCKVKFMIMAVYYFTKWVEAELLATITSKVVTKFLWKNIISRFEAPESLATDNGR